LTAQFTTLFTFNYLNGSNPVAGLTVDANGNLFGTTVYPASNGDPNSYGTVFEIKNTGTFAAPVYASAPTTLITFNGYGGTNSVAKLIVDANGDLFGTTSGIGTYGIVFEIKNTDTVAAPVYASAPTTLVTFNGLNGSNPDAGLITDANGNLFGTTFNVSGYGTVFEIKNTGTFAAPVYASAPTTLVHFDGSNGTNSVAGLIADANGDLFGTTTDGANNHGTVFEVQNIGTVAAPIYASAPTTLASFYSPQRLSA
jgi:hypothetical protein